MPAGSSRAPTSNDLFADPQHPYTIGLLGSIPRIDVDRERLATIEGTVPSPNNQPKGCRFAPRCPFADLRCRAAAAAVARYRARAIRWRAGRRRSRWRHERCRPRCPGLAGRWPGQAFCGQPRPHPPQGGRPGARRRGRQLRDRPRRDAGAGRRVRLRQVDHRTPGAAPDGPDGGLGALQGQGDRQPRQGRAAPVAPAHADHLSGPLCLAQSAHDRGRDPGRAAAGARDRRRRVAAPRAAASSWKSSACCPNMPGAIRINSPAGSASVSALRARLPSIPT